MTPRRCMDCPQDATHTFRWHGTSGRWQIVRTANQEVLHLYCRWHARLRCRTRNAMGVLPPMAQLRKLLGTSRREEG